MLLPEQRALADVVGRVARHGPQIVTPEDVRLLVGLARASDPGRRLDRETGRQIAAWADVYDAARSVPEAARLLVGALAGARRGGGVGVAVPAERMPRPSAPV